MHVRTTPSKKRREAETPGQTTGPRKSKKRTSAARQELPLSTNVSSPAQNTSKRSIRQYQFCEDDDDNDWREAINTNSKSANGKYVQDGFCVPDELEEDGDDDSAFETMTEASRPAARRQRKPSFGPRIETDLQLDQLNPIRRGVVEDFVNRAKQICQKLVVAKSLRAAPFSDTILREMGIRFTCSLEEMLEIPGIDLEKVSLYGKRFFKLIKSAENSYHGMMSNDADRPMDPNHQTVHKVVDLLSTEDEQEDMADENDESPPSSPQEQSSYFQGTHQVAPGSHTANMNNMHRAGPSRSNNAGLRKAPHGSSKAPKQGARKASKGSRASGSSGYYKKAFSRKRTSGLKASRSKNGGGQKAQPARTGGIGMMPT